ncbi:MAG: InlB B-repeat-containing protein [Faecalibacterium sp.]|uniref:InlB B-repeat-containing protein n=1 Tax=Faecalibacterium sp. TaxID=1971605 RepID=UPI0039928787
MRKKSTRLLSAALAACMMLSVLPVGAFAAEPGAEEQENGASAQAEEEFVQPESVEINSTNFQDTDFQNYVKQYDKDGNGSLSLEERNKVTTIELPDGSNCPTMKGIEYFPELVTLKCSNTHVRSLDVSKNLKLETLWCNWNNLEQLDVSKNKALKDLRCGDNYLTTLNVSQNEALEWLSANDMRSKLNSLDVSYNKALKHLECTKNGLTSLDVSSNEALEQLVCNGNPLTELDVSKNDKLTSLDCRRCGLTSLKFGSAVSSMECDENQLTVLDISQNTKWTDLRCGDNKLTSLSFNENVVMPPVASIYTSNNRYQIAVDADGIYDLSQLPGNFDVSKTSDWTNGERNGTELKVTPGSTTVIYKYNTGSAPYTGRRTFNLDVHWHNYRWKHDGTKHWRKCITANCPGLTDAQEAPHVYDNAKDNNCNTCGYVRPLYTVTTGENVTAKLGDEVLNAPVAAGTEVTLTAGDAPVGKTFAGWKLYKVVNDTESEITDETELAELLRNGIATTATLTLTMPAYDVKAEPYYSNIPYNIKAVNCTVDKTEAAKGDTVTATRREPEANEHFIDWTVKVNGVEQDTDTFLKPNANDPTKVTFTMPSENVEVTANFASNPTLNPTLRVGDHVTATIEGSDASVPSGSTVPVPKNKIVHLTATAPGQHFISWTVKVNGVEQDPTFLKPDADDPTKVTFIMPDANVEVTATFADDPIGPDGPDPVGPSDTGNIQGAISAVVIGAAAGVIAYEAGTGIYRVINMPGIPMPSNRIELAELLWEHAGKPEPVSTALYSDIDEGDTDAQKAARWAVEQDLMKDDADNNKFHPAFPVSKLRTCLTWNAAKEKGLFDKTEE